MGKFFIMSGKGEGLGLGLRLKDEGHEVIAWIKDKRSRNNFNRLIKKIDRYEDGLDKEQVVVFDSAGGGRNADRLRGTGYRVLSGSTFADQLEQDTEFSTTLMREVGIQVPPSTRFTDWKVGQDYLTKRKFGTLQYRDSGMEVEGGTEELIGLLEFLKSQNLPAEYSLRDRVPGVTVTTEGWFNGRDWVRPFTFCLEANTLCNDDLGPPACSGTILWATEENEIIREGLGRIKEILKYNNYLGPISLRTIIDQEGVWGVGWKAGIGYGLPAFLELLEDSVGNLLSSIAKGEHPAHMKLHSGFAGSVTVSIPPYPTDRFRAMGGVPIRGWGRTDRPHIYLYDVMLDAGKDLTSSDGFGLIAAVTGRGTSIQSSLSEPYRILAGTFLPYKQYRTDLTNNLQFQYAAVWPFLGERTSSTESQSELESILPPPTLTNA